MLNSTIFIKHFVSKQTVYLLPDPVCVEPNINSGKLKIENVELEVIGKEAFQNNSPFSIINSQLNEVDIVVFLVGHKEFKDLGVNTELDFCGVTN